MRCYRIFLLAFLLLPFSVRAQWMPWSPQDSLPPVDVHGGIFTGVSMGNGGAVTYLGVAPRVDFHPSSKFTLSAGFSVLNTVNPHTFALSPRTYSRRAPYKSSTLAMSFDLSSMYWVNDRFRISAMVSHQRGEMLSPGAWSLLGYVPVGAPVFVDRTAVAADMFYRFNDDFSMRLHVAFIRDNSSHALFGLHPFGDLLCPDGCHPSGGFDASFCPWGF